MTSPGMAVGVARYAWALIFISVGLMFSKASAQNAVTPYSPASRTDAYGNAEPGDRERRAVGWFQNEAQRSAYRGFQWAGRRANRRGGVIPFALAGDRLWRAPVRGYGQYPSYPAGSFEAIPTSMRRAFHRYGGFGQRPGERQADDIATVLERRRALIQATSMNAPVRRAMWELGSTGGLPPATLSDLQALPGPPEPSAAGSTLDQALRLGVSRSYARCRADGWTWFAEGHYRRAARAFEAVRLMEPADFESRIGELFCFLSLGAMRTSSSLLEQLARRDPNPFAHDLNVTERYGQTEGARQVRLRAQLWAQGAGDAAGREALHLLVLWYLGERDEAEACAARFARDFAGSIYADWPVKIVEANAAVEAADEEP